MTKNISVIDENGNITGCTYPKRAAGLVKKGRARWIDESIICLCARKEEEIQMNIYEMFDNQISKMQEQLREADAADSMPVRMQILKTLENVKKSEQADEVLGIVRSMQGALNREAATAENSTARELTRQKMLDLLAGLTKDKAVSA